MTVGHPHAKNGSVGLSHTERPTSAQYRGPEYAVAAALLVSFLLIPFTDIGHDQTWQLWIARQLNHGVRLYDDILEVNPPLWFWMAVPIVALSELVSISAARGLHAAFFIAMSLSMVLVGTMYGDRSQRARLALYATLLVAYTIMALPDFGQREHFVLIASAPYVVLIAARSEGTHVRTWAAFTVALLAAFGFSLKHYFAAVPLALEIWLWYTLRKDWSFLRPELLVLAFFVSAYVMTIVVFTPDYFQSMVPLIQLAYGGYDNSLPAQVAQLVVPLVCLTGFGLFLYRGPRTSLGVASWIAALVFLGCYFIQQKGWRYHSLPAMGMIVMCVGAETAIVSRELLRRQSCSALALGAAVALAACSGALMGTYRNSKRMEAQSALAGLPRGTTVMMLAAHPSTIWPMVEDLGLVWPSRAMISWMIPAIVQAQKDNNRPHEMQDLAADIRQQTLHDLLCHPPSRILVDDPRRSQTLREMQFDYMSFFAADPSFAQFLRHYRWGPQFGRFSTLDLADTNSMATPARCRGIY